MSTPPADDGPSCPLTRGQVIDRYFLEHRAKLLDVAAFLDRVDRAPGDATDDFRMQALHQALRVLIDGQAQRAARVLDVFSDPTRDLLEAAGEKGACGAWPGTES